MFKKASSYHSLQLAGLQPPSLPEIGLPHDVELADHRHALDDAGLLRVLRLWLQAVQVLPCVHGLQVGHFPKRGLSGSEELRVRMKPNPDSLYHHSAF